MLYGGEPGGGKSDLLIALPRLKHKNAVLFRRTYPRLEDTIIKRSREIFGNTGKLNESRHEWKFKDGCEIKLRAMEHNKDMLDYASAQYDFIGFDELTEFDEEPYLFLFSRLRTSNPDQRCRVVSATNPIGEGTNWVRRRWGAWLDKHHPGYPTEPGALRWYRRDEQGQDIECSPDHPDALSRTFIKAGMTDNVFISTEEYRRRLSSMREPFRSALMNGDWDAMMGEDAKQVISGKWLRTAMDRWKPRDNPGPLTCLGVDVSRGGQDASCYAPRHGNWFGQIQSVPGSLTTDGGAVVSYLIPYLTKGGYANMDIGGIGASPVDLAGQQGMNVNPINFASATEERDVSGNFGFVNLRALMYWRLREALDPDRVLEPGEEPIEIPPDDELFADLTAPHFELKARGIQIESKDDIKKRLGRSPDKGDALVLANLSTGYNMDVQKLLDFYRGNK